MIVRCTARLLKLLTPLEVSGVPPAPDDWYANLIWIDRRKCLLVVHADTLFPVFAADVRKPQLANFGQYVAGTVANALADEGLAADCLDPLDPSKVRVVRTASRSVLGVMNDMASIPTHRRTIWRTPRPRRRGPQRIPASHPVQARRLLPPDRRRAAALTSRWLRDRKFTAFCDFLYELVTAVRADRGPAARREANRARARSGDRRLASIRW